jgi:23S rRNA-/tRNA-specific pseudouridylate synthase
VIAKLAKWMTSLSNLKQNLREREYVALVWGNVTEEEGTIEGNLARSLKDRKWLCNPELCDTNFVWPYLKRQLETHPSD